MATVAQLRTAAHTAGFRGAALTIAVAIALAESGGNENAVHKNSNGTTDYGAWQINSVHATLLAGKNPYDLQQNADMAYAIYLQSNFTPWTTYRSNAYAQYLQQAQSGSNAGTGAKHQGGNVITSGQLGDTVSNINPISDVNSLIGVISDPGLWRRIGLGFLAFLLLLIGLVLMLESSKTVRTGTADAAKVAAIA